MRKVLLVAAATAFVATGFAQSSKMTVEKENLQMVEKVSSATMNVKPENMAKLPSQDVQQLMRTEAKAKGPNKVMSNGIFYSRPAGTLYGGWDWINDGRGYYFTTLLAPMMTDLTFENKCVAASTWTVNGQDAMDEVVDNSYVGNYPKGKERGISLYYAPTVSTAAGSYTMGEYNVYYKREYTTTKGLVRIDSLTCMYPSDPMGAYLSGGQYYSPRAAWGILDNDNLFGSGSHEDYGKATYSAQLFPKPASPLFFTKILVNEVLTATQPIPEGTKMRALITGVKFRTVTYRDGSVEEVKVPDMENIIDVLYAEAGDTLDFVSTTARNGKTLKEGSVVYSKPGEEDILGNVIPGNVVVDEEFAVVLADMELDGVNYGISANRVEESDDSVEEALLFFENDRFTRYSAAMALNLSLYGMFDKAYAPQVPGVYTFENEQLDYRIVTVPTTGSTEVYGLGNCTYGATGSPFAGASDGAGWAGVPVFTNVSWFDADDNDNYSVVGLPDWITGIVVDDTSFPYGLNNVMFNAEPLPAGETGRFAVVYVAGQEANMNGETVYSTVSDPITIIQGQVNLDDVLAVKNVPAAGKKVATGKTYSLTGQRVAGNFKGLVIRDGKKFIVK